MFQLRKPHDDWLGLILALLCAAATLGIGVLVSDCVTNTGLFYYKSQKYEADRAAEAYCKTGNNIAVGQNNAANNGENDGDKEVREKYNACQQWRSAQAAERSAFYTSQQMLVAWFGFAVSFVTLIVAGAAAIFAYQAAMHTESAASAARDQADQAKLQTIASRDSANAAIKAAKVAADDARRRFKPWIDVAPLGPFYYNEMAQVTSPWRDGEIEREVLLHADIVIKCIGDQPATVEDVFIIIAQGCYRQDLSTLRLINVRESSLAPPMFKMLKAGESIMYTRWQGLVPVNENPNRLIQPYAVVRLTESTVVDFVHTPPGVRGFVIFSDAFGNRYEHSFAFHVRPYSTTDFIRYGGREANHEREYPADV